LNADGSNARFNVGHFFMAISIESFLPINEFKSNIGNLLRELRASRKMPGQPRIFTAGEKEFYNELEVKQNGVPINEALNQDIQYIRHLLNMSDFETNA
jgi:LDH2 family malate/lactate/ureidoglycolate dehydrogenase